MTPPHEDFDPIDEGDDVPRIDPADCFSPPVEVCECYCLHCGRTFMSDGMWLQAFRRPPRHGARGFWMCPTPNCDGRGFTFDIFPTDPNHPCNTCWSDQEDDGLFDDDLSIDEEPDDWEPPELDEYDPDEPQYRAMEGGLGFDEMEGEEWKLGLSPGDYPLDFMPESVERPLPRYDPRYDEPDRRPREIDYTEPEHRYNEDDLPF